MKIPLILAQESVAVPSASRYTGVQETGLTEIGRGLTHVGDVLAKAAEAKNALAAKTEAAMRKSEFDVGLATMDSNLRLTHSDPDAYLAAYTQGVQQLHTATLDNTQSPDAKALLGIELTRAAGLHLVEAQKHYNSLYTSRAEGQLDVTLDNKKVLLGSSATDEQKAGLYGEGVRAIDNLFPILGEKRAAERKIAWRNDFLMDVEGQKIDANPGQWTPRSVQNILPADKVAILENRADRELRRRQAEEDRGVVRDRQELNDLQEVLMTELTDRWRKNDLTMVDVQRYGPSGYNILGTKEMKSVIEMADKPYEAPSNPEVKARLFAIVHDPLLVSTEAIRKQVLTNPQLNRADKQDFLTHLESVARGQISGERQQALESAKLILRTKSVLDFDGVGFEATARLEAAINRRTAPRGTETVDQVLQDVLPKLYAETRSVAGQNIAAARKSAGLGDTLDANTALAALEQVWTNQPRTWFGNPAKLSKSDYEARRGKIRGVIELELQAKKAESLMRELTGKR